MGNYISLILGPNQILDHILIYHLSFGMPLPIYMLFQVL